jgi:drug/metabolite transporter (DMT)-like permease
MATFNLNKKPAQLVLLLFLSFIWGASFILIKRGLESYTDIQVGTIRIFSASLILVPFIFKKIKLLKLKHILPLLVTGFLGNLIPAFLFAKAQTHVNSSVAGMLNATFPVMALIIGYLFYKDQPGSRKIIGIVIGLIGAAGIILFEDSEFEHSMNYYVLFILVAVIMYSFSVNTVKHRLQDLDGFTISIFSFAMISPVAGIILIFSDFSKAIETPDHLENLMYIVLLGIGSSAVAVSLFYILVDYTDVAFSSLTTYIIPIFALLWGFFDREKVTIIQIVFMLIILTGVFLVNLKSKKDRMKSDP